METHLPITSASIPGSQGDADLSEYRKLLLKWFGYTDLRPAQERALASLERRDVFAVSPTGSGKSMSYVLPALRDGRVLVVSPHIALMQDQVESLRANGVSAAFINSTLTNVQKRDTYLRFRNGEISLLYTSPESLANQRFVSGLAAIDLNLLAIDEAHCVSEWGHTFRPDYLRLREVRDALGSPRTLALTATATPLAREDIVRRLGLEDADQLINSVARENLKFSVEQAASNDQKRELLTQYVGARKGMSGIVYVGSRARTEELAELLLDHGVSAQAYHAGLDAEARRTTQRAFMTDEVDVIVATNAFGLGVDKPNVRFVVHFDMPGRLEAYYQEAGRAGRDGEPAECELIYTRWSRNAPEYFISQDHPTDDQVRQFWHEMLRQSDEAGEFGYEQSERSREHEVGRVMAVQALQDSGLLDSDGVTLLSSDPNATVQTRAITRHMNYELEMLGSMVEFATTSECRLSVVLRYFGEPGGQKCGRCDNCLGIGAEWQGKRDSSRKQKSGGRATPPEPISASHPDRALFEELRAWRKKRAEDDSVPAFVVFPDRTLIELARKKPRDMIGLTNVSGVGSVKRDRYGIEVLEIIRSHE